MAWRPLVSLVRELVLRTGRLDLDYLKA